MPTALVLAIAEDRTKACAERVDFMIVAHDARFSHDRRLGSVICHRWGLFLQVLKLAEKARLAKLGHVALDGTKIKANASGWEAMS